MANTRKLPRGIRAKGNMLYIQKVVTTIYGKERLSESTGFRLDEKGGVEKAVQFLHQRVQESEEGRLKSKKTIKDVAEKFLEEAKLKERTLNDYVGVLKTAMNYGLGDIDIVSLNSTHMKPYVVDMVEKGRKNRTIDKTLAFLNSLKNLAAQEYKYSDGTPWASQPNPLPRFNERKAKRVYGVDYHEDQRESVVLSWEKQNILLDGLLDYEETGFYHDLALFALNTGARYSEMSFLRWDEEVTVDAEGSPLPEQMKGRVFHIDHKRIGSNKGGRYRYLCLNDTAKKLVDKRRGNDSKYVFIYTPTTPESLDGKFKSLVNKPLDQLSNKKPWLKARAKLGYAKDRQLAVHHLRHTFSTRLRDAGVQGLDIDDLMGHKNGKGNIRRKYSHANLVKLVEGVNTIDSTRIKPKLFVVGQ